MPCTRSFSTTRCLWVVGKSWRRSVRSSRQRPAAEPELSGSKGMRVRGKTALVRRVLEELPADFAMLRAEADELARNRHGGVHGQLGPTSSDGPFGAGLELLELLGTLQDSGPVAVIVEDLHWADAASRPVQV